MITIGNLLQGVFVGESVGQLLFILNWPGCYQANHMISFHDPLSDNYQLSLYRLQGLLRRLKQDLTVLKEYDNIIKNQLKMGIIEAIPDEDPLSNVHYMLHHAVICRGKSTMKVRVVYDASAKTANSPLNDCLYNGLKLNQLILIFWCDLVCIRWLLEQIWRKHS